MKPMKSGNTLADHARPIAEIMMELTLALQELKNYKAVQGGE